jgi:hypothetical protein
MPVLDLHEINNSFLNYTLWKTYKSIQVNLQFWH